MHCTFDGCGNHYLVYKVTGGELWLYYNSTVNATENLSVSSGPSRVELSRITRLWKYHNHRGRVHRERHDLRRECDTGSYSLCRYVLDECLRLCELRGNHLSVSLKTPQVLELSGIGTATILRNAGAPVVLDFPGIGENLQDQPFTATDYLVNQGIITFGKKLV